MGADDVAERDDVGEARGLPGVPVGPCSSSAGPI
jgi:hypothetical protein